MQLCAHLHLLSSIDTVVLDRSFVSSEVVKFSTVNSSHLEHSIILLFGGFSHGQTHEPVLLTISPANTY